VNYSGTTVLNQITYDAYGQILSQSNLAYADPYGYTGFWQDVATGLLKAQERWYNPATGLWETQDPIGFAGGLLKLDDYVGNDPTNLLDPSGLEPPPNIFDITDLYQRWKELDRKSLDASPDDYRETGLAAAFRLTPLDSKEVRQFVMQQLEEVKDSVDSLRRRMKLGDEVSWDEVRALNEKLDGIQANIPPPRPRVDSTFTYPYSLLPVPGTPDANYASIVAAGAYRDRMRAEMRAEGYGNFTIGAYLIGQCLGLPADSGHPNSGGLDMLTMAASPAAARAGAVQNRGFNVYQRRIDARIGSTYPATLPQCTSAALGGGRGGFNPQTASPQQYTDEIGKLIGGLSQGKNTGMNCADCAVNTDILLRTGQVVPVPGRATDIFPGALAQMYRSPFVSYGKDMAGVEKTMSRLPEGSTGILFLSRGKSVSGHFINVVNKGGEIQYWCGQNGKRISDPIKDFELTTPTKSRSYPVVSVDLMITSKGGGPVIKGSLPR
jgi:RHS repeat-associated protein